MIMLNKKLSLSLSLSLKPNGSVLDMVETIPSIELGTQNYIQDNTCISLYIYFNKILQVNLINII